MSAVPTPSDATVRPLFADGLGERVAALDDATGEPLHLLRVRPALTAAPAFESALRERTARLAAFRHPAFAAIRRIDRTQLPEAGLAIVSDRIEGTRLADLLHAVDARCVRLDITIAMSLIRQLVPAVAQLHEHARDAAHGLLAPERLVITPSARLIVVEHVLGSAVEQLRLTRERLWQDLRVALPSVAGLSRFDQRADITAVGLVALALILGRPLRGSEFPHGVAALLGEARERTAAGEEQALSAPLRDWLARLLQLDPRRPFGSAVEALAVLEDVVAGGAAYGAPPLALQKFLARHAADLLEPRPSPPAPIEAPASPSASIELRRIEVTPIEVTRVAAASIEPAPLQITHAEAPSSEAVRIEVTRGEVATLDIAPLEVARPAPPVVPAADPSPALDLARVTTVPLELDAPLEQMVAEEPTLLHPTPSVPVRTIIELIATDELLAPQQADGAPLFEDESPSLAAAAPVRAAEPGTVPPRFRLAAIAAAVVVMAAGGYAAPKLLKAPTGTVEVQSSPSGVDIVVDGERRGATPARLILSAGAHTLELRGRGTPRVTPITVTPGAETKQFFELVEKPQTGQLRVPSQPAGARVLVDGVARGTAPVTVLQLAPGDHEVVLQSPTGTVRQTVTVRVGLVSALALPLAPEPVTARSPGWITVKSPIAVELREGGKLLGTSDGERLMLGAGRHELEIANPALDYRVTRSVQIVSNKAAELVIELPSGSVNLNASPWAEVFIDGKRVGETPIGNLPVAIGAHEVLFRNPQLGEKREAISVTLAAPVRLSVDMK